jgi:hypothetical protein
MTKIRAGLIGALLAAGLCGPVAAAPSASETIVLVRHGEKPALGLGQLDCQGLNRALALPVVIARDFGKPAAIFAPDPAQKKDDLGQAYDYVRPLATTEPAAIAFGLPIHADIGVSNIAGLRQALEAPAYHGAFVLVAWEHSDIVDLVRAMMKAHGGDPAAIPNWNGRDFDSIFVVRLTWAGEAATIQFQKRAEGLNGQPKACPG